MTRVYEMPELTVLDGDERLYIVNDPTGTPQNNYVDIATLDLRWAAINGSFSVNTVASSGSSQTLPLLQAHKITLSTTCTFTFPTPTTAGYGFLLYVTGAFSFNLPASVRWDQGTPPTYTSPSIYSAV